MVDLTLVGEVVTIAGAGVGYDGEYPGRPRKEPS
jgi:hypothetical protein